MGSFDLRIPYLDFVPQIHMLKFCLPVPQYVTVFRDRVFKEVI